MIIDISTPLYYFSLAGLQDDLKVGYYNCARYFELPTYVTLYSLIILDDFDPTKHGYFRIFHHLCNIIEQHINKVAN